MTEVGRKLQAAPRPNLVERRMTKFFREPPSVRTAASVIVTATVLTVVIGGVAIRLFDHSEYADAWVGMSWALQTVYHSRLRRRHSGPSEREDRRVVRDARGNRVSRYRHRGNHLDLRRAGAKERGLAEAAADEAELERLEAPRRCPRRYS